MPPKPNPNAGHRQRLRERFAGGGAEAVADYELLELILFNAIPVRDVKPLAKRLIGERGSLAGVLSAPPDAIIEAVEGPPAKGEDQRDKPRRPKPQTLNVVHQLSLVRAAALHLTRAQVMGRPALSSWSDLLAYCRSAMSHETTEQFRVLYLDTKNQLIADEVLARGTIDHVPVYVREVVKRGLARDAKSLILVHNHPSGDPTPSKADIAVTQQVVAAARTVDLGVHDHVIVGRGRETSLRSLGLM